MRSPQYFLLYGFHFTCLCDFLIYNDCYPNGIYLCISACIHYCLNYFLSGPTNFTIYIQSKYLSTYPAEILQWYAMWYSRCEPARRKNDPPYVCYFPVHYQGLNTPPHHCLPVSLSYRIKADVDRFMVSLGWFNTSVTRYKVSLLIAYYIQLLFCFPNKFLTTNDLGSLLRKSSIVSSTLIGVLYGYTTSGVTVPYNLYCTISKSGFYTSSNLPWSHGTVAAK